LEERASGDLLKRAQEARKSAESIDDRWMKELLEHIAQEYERAAQRVAILSGESGAGEPPPSSESSLFAI